MLQNIWGSGMELREDELLRRQARNRKYMMDLKSENLLLNFNLEAGRYTAPFHPDGIHGGWEAQTCQLRGHFLGHWLSAAAMHVYATGDIEIKAKADAIVHELALCQQENGGRWVGSIPEKYLDWIARGKQVWAPHYNLHKTLMGLVDMAELTGSREALDVADRFADWFYDWTAQFTREQMDDILDFETGGMLEIWAQLLALTGDKKYRVLLERYYRGRLFTPLLEGKDVLTNMHANTTIPEVLGCARAYEVTGEQHWRDIVEAYWKLAVDKRGAYATGGQTSGEVWSAIQSLGARLGDKNQEYCTVYNMLRLAEYLFRWTKDPKYADYFELGIYNGLLAQAYWQRFKTNGQHYDSPDEGLLTYFLPLAPGSKKGWASETNDFFCCHGTLVQANAAWERAILYQEKDELFVTQYFNFDASVEINGRPVSLSMVRDTLTGSFHLSSTSSARQNIHENTAKYPHHPDCRAEVLCVKAEAPATFTLNLRIPWWVNGEAVVSVNGTEEGRYAAGTGFVSLRREWKDGDTIRILMPQNIHTWSLPEDKNTVAFLYGPVLLAGLCGEERHLEVPAGTDPAALLVHDGEREWGAWRDTFKVTGQAQGFRFLPMYQIGYDAYTTYFPLKYV